MSQKDKLLKKIKNNPKDVSFDEACKLLEWFGFEFLHATGSHHKFKKGEISLVIPRQNPLKPIYIKHILERLDDEN